MEFERWAAQGIVSAAAAQQQDRCRSSDLQSKPAAATRSGGVGKAKPASHNSKGSSSDGGDKDVLAALWRSSGELTGGGESWEEAGKCAWVRSQLAARGAEFTSGFGTQRLVTYADHAASGQPLVCVENVVAQLVLPFYGNTHTEDSHVGQVTSRAVRHAREFVKRCLGATDDEALLFCGSGATGALKKLQECIGLTAPYFLKPRLLKMMHPLERWVVFVGPFEHHSNLLSWRESLAEVVEIPLNRDGSGMDMAKLEAAVQNPAYADRPKLGSFAAASNVTGIITDTRAVARLMHRHGAFVCFDFASSAPHVKIDMRAGQMDGYDALVLSPHKLVGGPSSPGILVMSKDLYLLKDGPPSTCGGGTVAYVNGFSPKDTVYLEDVETREDAGTPPILQQIRAALALWVKEELVGVDLIQRREQWLIRTAIARLQANPCVEVLGNIQVARCPILSLVVHAKQADKDADGDGDAWQDSTDWRGTDGGGHDKLKARVGKPLHCRFVAKLLNDLFGVQVRAGCACAGPYAHALLGIDRERSLAVRDALIQGYEGAKPGFVRLSFAYYMSDDEADFILSAVEFVAAHGQRFLPCYDLDWSTGDWTCKPTLKDLIIPQPRSRPGWRHRSGLLPRWPRRGRDRDRDEGGDDGALAFLQDSFEEAPGAGASLAEVAAMSPAEKYGYYLEVAHTIAGFLPEFPSESHDPPKLIDPFIIDFRL